MGWLVFINNYLGTLRFVNIKDILFIMHFIIISMKCILFNQIS